MRPLARVRAARRAQRGLSLTELMIGSSILVVLGFSIASSNATMRDMTFSSTTQSQLQDQARRAMDRIAADIRWAGPLTLVDIAGTLEYPLIYDAEIPQGYDADEHQFEPAPKAADQGDSDFGLDLGILLLRPADANGDGAPDFDLATGELTWGIDERVSYSRRAGMNGEGLLVRTVDGGATQIVARNLELLRFEMTSPVNPDVPLDTVRVRIAFRDRGSDGVEHRYATEFLVRMRSHD